MVVKKVKLAAIELDRTKVNETIVAELKQIYLNRKGIPVAIVDKNMIVVSNFETAAVLKDLGVPEVYVEQVNV